MVFGSAFTLATSVLVVEVAIACFNSWDQFFSTIFKSFQSLGLGVSVRATVMVRFIFQV